MVSIIVLAHNARDPLVNCLKSLLESVRALQLGGRVEYILLDDCSDAAAGIAAMFGEFRSVAGAAVRGVRFREHRHYSYGVACGLSLARGESVLFVSHDMVVPPACVRTLLATAAANGEYGVLRCRSGHMDCGEPWAIRPNPPARTGEDAFAFAEAVEQTEGLTVQPTHSLIGDSMLVRRAVIDRIGVFDTRFVGLLADVDYGIRTRRAGFGLGIARGAWLHHEGAVVTKQAPPADRNRGLVLAAYENLRAKWGASLPANYGEMHEGHLAELSGAAAPAGGEYQPPMGMDANVWEVLW